jgi:hypothetical protein
MNTELRISGIVANISAEAMVDTGNGMATLWNYPEGMKDIIPMPLSRLTVFDPADVMLENGKSIYPSSNDVEIRAVVRHLAYGIMQATFVTVTKVITNT